MTKLTKTECKWCDQGVPLHGAQHWIVQSIIPAKIKIVACKKVAKPAKAALEDTRHAD